MGSTRIKDLDNAASVLDTDAVAIDGALTGTKKLLLSGLWEWIMNKAYSFANGIMTIPEAINKIGTMVIRIGIAGDTDLNDIVTPGFYSCATSTAASTLLNKPDGVGNTLFLLNVYQLDNPSDPSRMNVVQEYVAATSGGFHFVRYGNSEGWNGWNAIHSIRTMPTTIVADSDLNTITASGTYRVQTVAISRTILNRPTGLESPFVMDVRWSRTSEVKMQIIYEWQGNAIYIRRVTRGTDWSDCTFGDWVKQPTRKEIDNVYGLSYDVMTYIEKNADLNNFTTPGSYVSTALATTNTLINCPITNTGFSLHVESIAGETGQCILQLLKRQSNNLSQIYHRVYTGTTWGDWVKQPTRAEMDAMYGLSYDTKIALSEGTDLNTLTSPGSFVSKASAVTSTLINCPITDTGFSLHVESIAGGTGQYIMQTLRRQLNTLPQIYCRIYNGSTWGAWVFVAGSEDVGFTASSDVTSYLVIKASGNVVTVNGYCVFTTAPTAKVDLGTLESKYIPAAAVRIPGVMATNAYSVGENCYVAVNTTGTISVTPKSNNTYKNVYFSASYAI